MGLFPFFSYLSQHFTIAQICVPKQVWAQPIPVCNQILDRKSSLEPSNTIANPVNYAFRMLLLFNEWLRNNECSFSIVGIGALILLSTKLHSNKLHSNKLLRMNCNKEIIIEDMSKTSFELTHQFLSCLRKE
jgi:hypothetical protein